MEKQDKELIAELINQNEELKQLVEDHREYETQIEEFNKRPYLTTDEEMARKTLQKRKLAGKDRISAILAEHRKKDMP